MADQVLTDAGLADIDAEFEEFAVDGRRAKSGFPSSSCGSVRGVHLKCSALRFGHDGLSTSRKVESLSGARR